MNNSLNILILFTCLSIVLGCQNDFDQSERHRAQHSHDYHDDHDHKHGENATLQDKYQNTNFESDKMDERNRWIWQKPNLIIDQLGPLENKVVADIGAGPYGYFSLRIAHQVPVKKVIAMDIDAKAISFMEQAKGFLSEDIKKRFETRLVGQNDAKLLKEEADIALIVNTVTYFEDRVKYFKNLKDGIAENGKLVIIDFKKRNTPVGPAIDQRVALGDIEQDLIAAGYKVVSADDRTLEFQYIVTATK